MSNIWFSFTPQNQNNTRRRRGVESGRSWLLRRFTEKQWENGSDKDEEWGLHFSLWLQLEEFNGWRWNRSLPPTPFVAWWKPLQPFCNTTCSQHLGSNVHQSQDKGREWVEVWGWWWLCLGGKRHRKESATQHQAAVITVGLCWSLQQDKERK